MIHYLTDHVDAAIMAYPSRWGGEGGARMRFLPYGRLLEVERLEPGTYLFADLESLTPAGLEVARQTCSQLCDAPGFRVVNRPERVLCRFALLERLFEAGINDFRAHRARDAGRVARFPVFVRRGDDHLGPLTPLLGDAHELARSLRFLRLQGHRLDDLLVVEFCDTRGPDGLYRKYAAFIVGSRILPRHVLFSRHWMLKQPDLEGPELEAEKVRYLEAHPHEGALREIFALAGIEYGRIDYGLRDGRVQVWEINTHPTVSRTTFWLSQAFDELDVETGGASPLELRLDAALVRQARRERNRRRLRDLRQHGIDRVASSPLARPLTRSLRHLLGQARLESAGSPREGSVE